MKRNLLLLAAALGFASASYAQTSYGLKAGVNFPKISITGDNGGSINGKASTNFYITGYADVNIAHNLSIQPGLSLQGKGSKGATFGSGEEEVQDDSKMSLMYLEVPVNFVYYIPAGSGNVFLGAGPYAAYGLSAKFSEDGASESGSFDDSGLNAFDGGLNFLGGYKLANGFLFNAGYGLGLANMAKEVEGFSVKNRVLSVGIGFQF